MGIMYSLSQNSVADYFEQSAKDKIIHLDITLEYIYNNEMPQTLSELEFSFINWSIGPIYIMNWNSNRIGKFLNIKAFTNDENVSNHWISKNYWKIIDHKLKPRWRVYHVTDNFEIIIQ